MRMEGQWQLSLSAGGEVSLAVWGPKLKVFRPKAHWKARATASKHGAVPNTSMAHLHTT